MVAHVGHSAWCLAQLSSQKVLATIGTPASCFSTKVTYDLLIVKKLNYTLPCAASGFLSLRECQPCPALPCPPRGPHAALPAKHRPDHHRQPRGHSPGASESQELCKVLAWEEMAEVQEAHPIPGKALVTKESAFPVPSRWQPAGLIFPCESNCVLKRFSGQTQAQLLPRSGSWGGVQWPCTRTDAGRTTAETCGLPDIPAAPVCFPASLGIGCGTADEH